MLEEKKTEIFKNILNDMIELICNTQGKYSLEILRISSMFLEDKTHMTIEKFYRLYSSVSKGQTDVKDEINNEVDRLVEQAKSSLHQGRDIRLTGDQDLEKKRLGLASMQKELESLITVEFGLKEKLTPILTSMQFEDAIRQRLQHVEAGWREIFSKNGNEDQINVEKLLDTLSSVSETELFYRIVLEKEPPEDTGKKESSVLLF